jgi:cytochrome c-type biogenesis protein CcmH/NrfG
VVNEKPDFLDGWILLGDVLEKLGRSEEAQEAHSKGSG